VSRQALEAWVSEHCITASLQQHAFPTEQFHNLVDDDRPTEISISDIICEHGALDPTMSRDMKLLTPVCSLISMDLKMS
jgi:ubiquitin carboxyl-terminal hydrolase 48